MTSQSNSFTTKDICIIALIACTEYIAFSLLSSVLYLEVITLILVAFGLTSSKRNYIYASIVFTICLIFNSGFTIYTFMYFIVYTSYSLLTVKLKPYLLNHQGFRYVYVGILSFMTGQLLDLSFIIFSSKITYIYILMGLKTSLIQGIIAGVSAMFLLDVIVNNLERLFKNYENK